MPRNADGGIGEFARSRPWPYDNVFGKRIAHRSTVAPNQTRKEQPA